MIFFWGFLCFIILQRLAELIIARRNAKIIIAQGAIEIDRSGYKYVVFMHISFFLSLILEKEVFQPAVNKYLFPLIAVFLMAQALRYWSIVSLGIFWNTRILILKGGTLVKSGPYRFFSHPNYAAVVTEIAVIPLIFSCYITAVIFSILNIIVLARRLRIEITALKAYDNR